MQLDEELNGWHPDPLGRFEERYIVYGEPSRLVRTGGVEQTDRRPLDLDGSAEPADRPSDEASEPPGPAVEHDPPVERGSSSPRSGRVLIGVAVVVLLGALIGGAALSRRHRGSTTPTTGPPSASTPPAPSAPSRPVSATPRPSSSPRVSVPRAGPDSGHALPPPGSAPAIAWADRLRDEVDNIAEVASDYGQGSLEATACRRAQADAARLPAPASARVTQALVTARRDVVTFATACAYEPARVCPPARGACRGPTLADEYRQVSQDLDVVLSDAGEPPGTD
jgi:hypothetical protein